MFRSRNKEHGSNKNALPCLLDTLSVFLWHTCTLAISALFQWVVHVGSLFSLSIFIFKVGNSDEAVGNTSCCEFFQKAQIDRKFH